MAVCYVSAADYQQWFAPLRRVVTGLRGKVGMVTGLRGKVGMVTGLRGQVIGAIAPAKEDAASYAVWERDEPLVAKIDADGNELGDRCVWCGEWYVYSVAYGPYCSRECAFSAEKD